MFCNDCFFQQLLIDEFCLLKINVYNSFLHEVKRWMDRQIEK